MKIAIIGGGIAGLATAWLLQKEHAITLYERGPSLGGHARTLTVRAEGREVPVDLGFRYLFQQSCPHVLGLLRLLEVPVGTRKASVHFEGIESGLRISLPPRTGRSALRLLSSARAMRYVAHYLHFLFGRGQIFARGDTATSLDAYALAKRFPADFRRELLYPFLGASWGMTGSVVPEVSAYSILKVMQPQGRFFIVEGGVGRYIARLVEVLGDVDLRPATPVSALRRRGATIEVVDGEGRVEGFDRVVLATESPVAAALARGLAGAEGMAAALGRFRTCDDFIVVHSDERLMPRDRGDWSVVNVRHEGHRAVLTEWSGMDQRAPVFRSFSAREPVVAERVHRVEAYKHPIVTPEHYAIQRELAALQGHGGVWAAGLYTCDVDNHESALMSAIRVARDLAPASPNLQALIGEPRGARAA
ncbi:MAG TPA: FAD-dependent oxidoreductase [Nannocystaceae bacterium]|nr:FAD-dependent oxidoreductase [Nannocystaceae bacterium]